MSSILTTYIRSLGCRVNQVEMEAVAEELSKAGIRLQEVNKRADLVLINTCSVTRMSDKKSRQLIRKAAAVNPGALVIVTGCYATNDPNAGKIEGVDLIVTNEEKDSLVKTILQITRLQTDSPVDFKLSRSRPYIKIADGCDEYCAYCIIPSLRGSLTSQPLESIKSKAEDLAAGGAPEIVLTGINIGKYGQDDAERPSLSGLIEHLDNTISALPRIRLSSIELNEVDDKIIDQIKDGILCRHLHIPLQSGSNSILKKMNRNYTAADFAKKIVKIRSQVPGICISTDVIAGFPGESASDFAATVEALETSGIDKVHAFKFSSRAGTAAYKMEGHLDNSLKSKRVLELNTLGARLYKDFISSQLNESLEIVLEDRFGHKDQSLRVGLSDNYIKILVSYEGSAKSVKVKTGEVAGNYLKASIVG